ncbi:MAG: queuosine salvage family protein [Candidatus Diapherotrites archaeon]|nr:queuosine salvage family protein [Candidatus Diapherotrites archaeon]
MNVLDSTKLITENSAHVKINKQKILEFCTNFDYKSIKHWVDEAPFDLNGLTDVGKLHFLFVFNAISFSYWGEPKWTISYKGRELDGSWAMVACIGKAIEQDKPILNPEFLSSITKNDLAEILQGTVEIPLLEKRVNFLNHLGKTLLEKFDGDFENVIKESKGDALKLLELIVSNFPLFNDSSFCNGEKIFFYKRAQLFVANIYQAFNGKGFGDLKNIDKLTVCADYKLPQVLRKLGILEYSVVLAEKIDSKTEIPKGSAEELEIRANTIWAGELIKQELKKKFPNIDSIHVNDHLWLLSQNKSPEDKPYHRTRTTAY